MLIQGLYDFPVLPNLCKQAALAWTARSLTMYEMARKCPLRKPVIAELLGSPDKSTTDEFYIRQLQRCHRRQITLIRDDSRDGDLYKLVSSQETTEIISEYKRSKTAHSLNSSRARDNPFKSSNEQQQQQSTTTEEKLILRDGELRCCAWTEMSLAILEACLREDNERFEKLLPIVYENATILISGSANLRVREFAGRFLRRLPEFGYLSS
ncbi:unnamed protein product [Gongylonema pulchrum]|uniref:ERCC4 domain-containing protein n=1 Tax=Gongylonema pulchrum TaxID=637853 RepID=A0A183DYX9_9BILA|nr:unnamed protein product [Gongylonema pulchrum]